MPFHLLDITMFYARHGGGVKRYLFCKRDWCLSHGISHTILVPGRKTACTQNIMTIASPLIPFSGGYRFPVNMMRFAKAIEQLKPDILEVGDPYQLAWISQSVSKRSNLPIAAFYHSDLPKLAALRLGKHFESLGRHYVKKLYSGFDLVLAPSQRMVDELESIGIRHVAHQPLGVDVELFQPQKKQDIHKRLGLSPEVKLLVYAGRFSKEKNIPALLETIGLLGNHYHLLLIGSGMRIPKLANVTHVRYLTSSEALAKMLASCDALIHAGDQETFGLVVLEAMACGLPIIGIRQGGVVELVDEHCGLLVEKPKASLLAEAVRMLFSEDWARFGQYGREKVLKNYQWNHALSILMQKYASLLGVALTLDEQPHLHLAT